MIIQFYTICVITVVVSLFGALVWIVSLFVTVFRCFDIFTRFIEYVYDMTWTAFGVPFSLDFFGPVRNPETRQPEVKSPYNE